MINIPFPNISDVHVSDHIFSLNFQPNSLASFIPPLHGLAMTSYYQVHKQSTKSVVTITVQKAIKSAPIFVTNCVLISLTLFKVPVTVQWSVGLMSIFQGYPNYCMHFQTNYIYYMFILFNYARLSIQGKWAPQARNSEMHVPKHQA
jgi:hypothetical protein